MGTDPHALYGKVVLCPRCREPLGDHPGGSRADRSIHICPDCAQDEAVRQAAGFAACAPDTWPVGVNLDALDAAAARLDIVVDPAPQ
jgi:hypothetical protein